MVKKKVRLKRKVKLIIYIIFLFFILSLFFIEVSIGKKEQKRKSLPYSKESSINYITYLKDNTHYDNKYLQKEFNLVANLIDYFNIDYNYSYSLGEKIDYKLNYSIDAVLEVYDSDNDTKPVEKKTYKLLKRKTIKDHGQIIKVDIFNQKVNYETYNKIVQSWKKEISPNANLKIVVKVNWKGNSKILKDTIFDECITEFDIPISGKTIDIKSPSNISEKGVIKSKQKFGKGYIVLLISTLSLFAAGVVYLLAYVSTMGKEKSKYDKKISRLLREFDRVITEAKGEFVMIEGENYIEVKDFMELLDVHDNINEPIIHYANNDDLNVFVIKNGNDTYYTLLYRSDFEE